MVEEESCSCEVVEEEKALVLNASLQVLGRTKSRLPLLEAPFGAAFSREKSASARPELRRDLSQEEKMVALPSSQSPVVVVQDWRLRFS